MNDQIQPQNLDAEKSVLGSMMTDRRAVDCALPRLTAEDFYNDNHSKLFQIMVDLAQSNSAVDALTVVNKAKSTKVLETIGGAWFITGLSESVPTTANIESYVSIVKDKAIKRSVIRRAHDLLKGAYDDLVPAKELVQNMEHASIVLADNSGTLESVRFSDVIGEVLDELDLIHSGGARAYGLETGFYKLDELTSGLHGNDLFVLAGRPGMGKTALALSIATNIAESETPVGFFSLEMNSHQLVKRVLFSLARIDSQDARQGKLSRADQGKAKNVGSKNAMLPIYMNDSMRTNMPEIYTQSRRWKSEHNVGLIIVDYLQLVLAGQKFDSREQEVAHISRSLKGMAKELDIPVLLLCQLNRGPDHRSDKRPKLADLRESGAIEQDADAVMLLYRDEVYHKNTDDPGVAEIHLAKQRNGPTGMFRLTWLEDYTRFENYSLYSSDEGTDDDVPF